MDLSTYKSNNRLLLVFAPSSSDGRYKKQKEMLQDQGSSFEDRELLDIHLFEGEPGSTGGEPVSSREAAKIRDASGVGAGQFAVILVGKDGGEKFRSTEPVSTREIFGRIDAMPMRRREMLQRKR